MQHESVALSRPSILVDMLAILAGSLVVAALAQISVDIGPVPQTAQTMGVLGVGAFLGSRRGAAALLLYLAEGAAGLPVFADGRGGVTVITGVTGGYLVGFVLAAFITGWICERFGRRFYVSVPAMIAGSVAIYACGLAWLGHSIPADWRYVVHWGLTVFVIGDLLKILAAAAVLDPRAPWGRWVGSRAFQ
jgi:biotin transport system substrate-specific component